MASLFVSTTLDRSCHIGGEDDLGMLTRYRIELSGNTLDARIEA